MIETNGHTDLAQLNEQLVDTVDLLQERISELELSLQGEDAGWTRLGGESGREFSRDAIKRIAALARLFYLANPLVKRAVSLQSHYVFGQGVNISGRHPDVDAVIQAFLDDPKNQAELTSHQARTGKEVSLQIEGNIFIVFFTTVATGRVRVRSLPADEVADIICDPEDAKSPWFYLRTWSERKFDPSTGRTENAPRSAYYPDWRHQPKTRQPKIGDADVRWDTPVYHVKVGGLPDMRFGVPETYAAHDWARAYKVFLEDVATLMRAYARFAGKVTNLRGRAGVAAAKTRMGTTYGTGGTGETNPPPLTGSIFMGADGVDYNPINIRGASVNPEDGRRLLLMVCAAVGLPETLMGDVSVGTLATAKSLDRPTELKFSDRRALWTDVHQHILGYAIKQAVKATRGSLSGSITTNDDGEEIITLGDETDPITGVEILDPTTGRPVPIDAGIDIDWPPILEHDVDAAVAAIVNAATLGGHPLAGTFTVQQATRLLFAALGQDDLDDLMDEAFPEDDTAPDDVSAGDGTGTTTKQAAPGATTATEASRKRSVKVKPRGKALATVPKVKITDADLRGASKSWDKANADATGLLEAEVTEQ